MKRKIFTHNEFILKEGHYYLWSGSISSSFTWKKRLCKIEEINNGLLSIYDFHDDMICKYDFQNLQECSIKFYSIWSYFKNE
jgi:hypothetical protein